MIYLRKLIRSHSIVVIAIVRLDSMLRYHLGLNATQTDSTFYSPVPVILGSLEINVAVLAASIPIFWPVVKNLGFRNITVVNEVTVSSEPRANYTTGELDTGSGGSERGESRAASVTMRKSEDLMRLGSSAGWEEKSSTNLGLCVGRKSDVEAQKQMSGRTSTL